ncbi:MAG: TlpA family protein disulfide reductase [Tannerella sp.]|jgi:peroxiredoxin|nr:TlpA family protein disulfide reductase [Tannerella sp.]
MKNSILFCFLLLIPFIGKAQDAASVIEVGSAMPAFTIVSDDGSQILSSQYEGKVILITFFATWCPPCQLELTEIEKVLWPKYKENNDFVLLVIGREHSDAELLKYNEKKGFTFPLYPDKNRKIYDSFASQFIPRAFLIDRDGNVVFETQGFDEKVFGRLLRIIDNTLVL